MKQYATISADIVDSTTLSRDDYLRLSISIKELLQELAISYDNFWGRLVKGDTIECIIDNPKDALRIAIMIKSFVKSFALSEKDKKSRFSKLGIRIAMGIGSMRVVDKDIDVMDGEAIYLSGRALSDKRVKVKNSMQVIFANDFTNGAMSVVMSCINHLVSYGTAKQCKSLFFRLKTNTDAEAAELLNIKQPTLSNSLRGIGWPAISQALDYYEHLIFE